MTEVKLEVMKGGKKPTTGTNQAACFDVYARKIEQKKGLVICHLGIKTEIKKGYKGVIVGRSNTTKHPYALIMGTVDSDYRDEWQARFRVLETEVVYKSWLHRLFNINPETKYPKFPYIEGDRVAQIYFDRVEYVKFKKAVILSNTKRKGGFGSTGLN